MALVLAVTPACATSSAVGTSTALQTVATDRGDVRLVVDQSPRVEVLSPPPDVLWVPLVQAHRALSIQPDLIDPDARTVGWTSATWIREFQGTPLSTYLDCGRSGTGGATADDARVSADFRTALIPLPAGGTEIRTWLRAVAQPLDGSSRGTVQCSSMKVLERLLAIELRRAYQAELDGEGATDALVSTETAPQPVVTTTPTEVRANRVFEAVTTAGTTSGERIRIVDRYDQRITGTIGPITPDEMTMKIVGRDSSMPWSDVKEFERRIDRPSKGVWGGVIGTVLGAVVGHVSNFGITGRHAESQGRVLGPGLGAVAGGLVGAWLGSRIGGGYWITVPLPAPSP